MRNETGILMAASGGAMSLLGVSAKGKLAGLLFELAVEQRYRNPLETSVKAVYTFPIPSGATLLGLELEIGGKRMQCVVVEKKQAVSRYKKVREHGDDTALMLERAGDGLSTLDLGDLMAGEEALIRYRYGQLLRFEQGRVRLCVPKIVAPRYNALAAGYPFLLDIELSGAVALGTPDSPSHAVRTTRGEGGVTVALARNGWLERDFVLSIGGLAGQSLCVVAKDGEGWVALASFCPAIPRPGAPDPMLLEVLVDCSDSMAGDAIDTAKRVLHRVLERLGPQDRFSVRCFGTHVHHLIAPPIAADTGAIRNAGKLVTQIQADMGGTVMETALWPDVRLGGRVATSDVLLITDGVVWNTESLLGMARSRRRRIFAVGVGAAPAEAVLRRLAEDSGGACEIVAPKEDVEARVVRVLARIRLPRTVEPGVRWPSERDWTTGLPTGLFDGETAHVFAFFAARPSGEAVLEFQLAGEPSMRTSTVAIDVQTMEGDTLARMAAAALIAVAHDQAKVELAVRYQIVTDLTDFIVVHARAIGDRATGFSGHERVAQMHAAGWGGVASVVDPRTCFGPLPRPSLQDLLGAQAANQAPRNIIAGLLGELALEYPLPTLFPNLFDRTLTPQMLERLMEMRDENTNEEDIVLAVIEAVLRLPKLSISRHDARAIRHAFSGRLEARHEALVKALASALQATTDDEWHWS